MKKRIAPKRIQRKRTKGWRMPVDAIYVGKPTQFANYTDWRDMPRVYDGEQSWQYLARQAATQDYKRQLDNWANDDPEGYRQALDFLKGHDLACWCPEDHPCHGDIWLERANCRCETYNWPLTAKGYICPNCRRIAQGVDFAMLRMRAYQAHCAEHPLADFEVCTDPWCKEIVAEEVRLGLLELEP